MIKAALVQFEPQTLQPAHNFERIAQFIEAEGEAADLILFPELVNTGYVEPVALGGPITVDVPDYGQALWQACAELDGQELQHMVELAAKHRVHLVLGLGLRDPLLRGVMRNTSVLIAPTGLVGYYTKVHQWHNEKLYFTPGDRIDTWQGPGCKLGMQICYDSRFPELTRIMALQGADIITNIWAGSGIDGAAVADEQLFVHRAYTRAMENGVFFLSCNRVGVQADRRFLGRSCAVAPSGRVIGALEHDREDVLRVDLDLDEIAAYRSFTGIWTDRNPALYARYLSPSRLPD
ncbi:carbon-nitrogen hydrolase family protein [Lampropedia aestuarii]|uniref:carbon-nitrogen hydrolase family protein n=1 Tax=Lampropedia aestuarii TaxID=2562762 RepID=UPI002468530C|nr:carbon-nitrogen hydrolase family protein [Lampropedia aestuarii]MDH5858698.1 carbon-nitrogen hydrolase family protein [Lampropedia aestuarii]